MLARLGVNIDHIATLRQQRGESYPSITRAAEVALAHGAHQITIHLREDRRHIQDADVAAVHAVCRAFNRPLNLELGCAPEIVRIAASEQPEWVCLVPEKREERTTEGGLNLVDKSNFERVRVACEEILAHSPQTKISLFVEADQATLEQGLKLPMHAIEVHTGDYAKDFLAGKSLDKYLVRYQQAGQLMLQAGKGLHAGHGLTDHSLAPLLQWGGFAEYNIGHWIVSEAAFQGLGPVVAALLKQMGHGGK